MELETSRRLSWALVASLLLHVAAILLLPPIAPRSPLSRNILQVTLAEPLPPARNAEASSPARPRPVSAHHEARPRFHDAKRSPEPRTSPLAQVDRSQPENAVTPSSPAAAMAAPPPAVSPVPASDPPPAAAASAVSPQPSPTADDVLAAYGEALSRQIARYREYPRLAQLRGWEGKVLLRLSIGPGARLTEMTVSRSSGHKVLDDRALEMVRQVAPLPAPPVGLRDKSFTVAVPVVFELSNP